MVNTVLVFFSVSSDLIIAWTLPNFPEKYKQQKGITITFYLFIYLFIFFFFLSPFFKLLQIHKQVI